MSIQGIIFDCDGTLADTMPFHWQAWQTVLIRYGLVFSEERFYALGGVPSRDILSTLSAEQGVALEPCTVAKEKEVAYLKLLPNVKPVEIVMEIAYSNHGKIPMAVASGGTKTSIGGVLKHLGVSHLFGAVVTSEDVKRQKPAPDIFLEAAARIEVSPRHCRAYEDTDLGMQAIRAAGMEAIDVRTLLAVSERL